MTGWTADLRMAEDWPSDETLMERVVAGDEGAFRLLADRHLQRLLRLAQRLLGDAAGADDVAQETLVRLWTNAASWRSGRSQLGTWLHAIVVRLCVDRMRARGRFAAEVPEELESPTPGALEELSRQADLQQLAAALETLEPRQRVALTLHYHEERSGQEAAEIMGISLRAYWSLLHRARRAAREFFQDF